MTKEEYLRLVEQTSPPSPWLKNELKAFLTGGLICVFAQMLQWTFLDYGCSTEDAALLVNLVLITLAALFTGFGLFSRIGRFCGAGTFVPITGFANSVVSPAIEFQTEGLVFGTAAKMFTVAGPVLVFGCTAASLMGLASYLLQLFR